VLKGKLKKNCVENGDGVRLSVFISGCTRHCPECHNPEMWDFEYGDTLSVQEIIEELEKPQYQGISILGGEPLEPQNLVRLYPILRAVDRMKEDRDVWLYTGYKYEDIKCLLLLKYVDVVVDGAFEVNNKVNGRFFGSSNQNIIRIKKEI